MANERLQDTLGAAISGGSFIVREGLEKVSNGFDWNSYGQEIIEDLTGAVISVTVGFFLMRAYRKWFKRTENETKQ